MSNNQSDISEMDLMNIVMCNNGYNLKTPWAKSIGFRPNSLKYAEQEKFQQVALDFLVNSRLKRSDRELESSIESYLEDSGIAMLAKMPYEDLSNYQKINLVDGPSLDLDLGSTINQRRSSRAFTQDKISFGYLSTILRAANGISAEAEVPLNMINREVSLYFRTVPSGGGLYPITAYIAVLNIDGLEQGIYRYHPYTDSLYLTIDKTGIDKIMAACSIPESFISISRSSCIVLFMGSPWKSMRKYGARGMRFMLHEVGSISQNIHLSVASLGLGSVDCGSYYDEEIHNLMGVDGVNNAFLHAIIIGVPG